MQELEVLHIQQSGTKSSHVIFMIMYSIHKGQELSREPSNMEQSNFNYRNLTHITGRSP